MNFDTNKGYMKTYRIGNTIKISWALELADGSLLEIIPENSELYIHTSQHKTKAVDFTVDGNILTWTFKGGEQKHCGPYTLTFVMNRDSMEMITVDCCNAFALVEWSCMAGGEDTPGIITSAIELHSILPNHAVPATGVPSFDIITSLKQRAVYVVGDQVVVDKYPILRFRNMAPDLTDKYHIEIYRYANRGRKRYQKRITIPLSELDKYTEPRSGYGAIVLNVSLMRIFWEMWDAQGIGQIGYTFHDGGKLQYDANAVAASWKNWDYTTFVKGIKKFNGLWSYKKEAGITSEVLISGRFALRLYDSRNNLGGEMHLMSIRLIEAAFGPIPLNWNSNEYFSGLSFSLRVK